jgi:hypothetical protein
MIGGMLGGLERAVGEGKVGMIKGLMGMVLAVQFGSGASVLPFGGASFVLQKVLYHEVWSLECSIRTIPLVLLSLFCTSVSQSPK